MSTPALIDDPLASHEPDSDGEALLTWSAGLQLLFDLGPDRPVTIIGIAGESPLASSSASQPLVELMITGEGRARTTTQFTNTGVGTRLRYAGHRVFRRDHEQILEIVQHEPRDGLVVTTAFRGSDNAQAVRVTTTVHNTGPAPVVVEAISSLAIGALLVQGESTHDLMLYSGTGEQLAENRWSAAPLWSQTGLADFNSVHHNQPGRGGVARISTSTWSTARALPTAALVNPVTGRSLAWQIEHNGGWRWEIDNVRDGEESVSVILLGPEDLDHQWAQELKPGEEFTSVPVSIAVADDGFEGALAQLTAHRRWLRHDNSTAARASLLIFNDYMNTLNGDPTTARLLPLVEAAAAVGAECFCIDAGWYDDTEHGGWWTTVGEWIPSTRRFPDGGLDRVVAAIRAVDMKVGLWLEPEVVGTHSDLARALPEDAFLQRHGRRIVEHGRYFLDLRHPAARAQLDATFDRLITSLEIDFFKLDYNVTPGPGTDLAAFSVGAGLLGHNRAHLQWFAELRRRYPHVIFENCSSGAMRADFAMLELFDLQSTSDQEDFRLYPVIAAGAPAQLVPEQAGNWAYPQPWMSDEEIAYTMVTGLSGRLYLSGFLDQMTEAQRRLVGAAVSLSKHDVRDHVAAATPRWPAGLPDWYADHVALSLVGPERTLLYVWHRGDADSRISLHLGSFPSGSPVTPGDLTELYPRQLRPWSVTSGPADTVVLQPGVAECSARVYEIQHRST